MRGVEQLLLGEFALHGTFLPSAEAQVFGQYFPLAGLAGEGVDGRKLFFGSVEAGTQRDVRLCPWAVGLFFLYAVREGCHEDVAQGTHVIVAHPLP